MASIKTNKLIALAVKPGLLISMLGVALTGCEAPLNLEGIEEEKTKSVRRTDQFQAVAANGHALVAVGNDGLILRSPADSLKWQRQSIDIQSSFVDIAACPDQRFVALSMDKQVWQSVDNGASWQASELPTPEDLLDLTCAPDNSVWVVGSFSTVLHSKDQGKTWQENTLNEDAMLTGIQFLDASTAIMTGEFGVVSRSNDGGQSWNPPSYIPNDFYTQTAFFTDANTGWVGGLSGQILYTDDGGENWTKQPTPTESPIYGFYQSGTRLFAFGDHSTVLEYTGSDWARVNSQGRPVYLRDAIQLSNGELLFAGGAGSLFTLDIQSGDTTQLSKK
ncbi:YCF48-related protein [uncultured Neptuniibacter sp.]|uniref:WD40/YVTN/BNR-like repeat-containing protein n=1 Tax=uncultured Neptuniibacter sp. TaxID=502143 RepID=UPI002607DDE8|nr:YCF48-related protein [uncultured Neptuniibacter sp.]